MSTNAEVYIVEGLLLELAEQGLNFQLSARPHHEEGFRKQPHGVRFADGSWKTKSVELVTDVLDRRGDELQMLTLKVTTDTTQAWSGRGIPGKIVGWVRLDISAGTGVIAEFMVGTGEFLSPFTRTAWERACAIEAQLESDRAAA